MANPPPSQSAPASRAEKLSVLSALLGPEALARLREGQPDAASGSAQAPVAIDADRAAWHHNKLLERLREQGRAATSHRPQATATEPPRQEAPSPVAKTPHRSFDMRLAALADLATLSNEHPAVVTRLIRTLAREDRVAVLKSLPGPLARMVVKRLR